MKKVLTIRTSTIVDNFYICGLRLKIGGEYNPKFTYADAIVTLPLTGRLPHINSDRFTQKLFDRPLDRISCEIVAQVPTSEKFLRLSAERQTPLHRKMLHSHAYSAVRLCQKVFCTTFLYSSVLCAKRTAQARCAVSAFHAQEPPARFRAPVFVFQF